MATLPLEERVEKLESKIQEIEAKLAEQARNANPKKRGWRWFVGIYADSPDFEDVVHIGQEWRNARNLSDFGKVPDLKVEDWSV